MVHGIDLAREAVRPSKQFNQILCRKHKRGIAKSVYDNFCKNYEASLGERYARNYLSGI